MKYLLQAIDAQRSNVRLSDHELRDLLVEVRSGKDDRIEFIDAMMRLLDELKGSEHAAAFLNKVAKRDAPDYYDVIKNPMDLGTMMRNVKSGRYKTKAQFTRDLDLIWDNCLTYNSEPTHPLRRSVQVLRAKANHLLTYVNDTNDVKEALNQWQAGLGLSPQHEHKSNTVAMGDATHAPASFVGSLPGSMPWAEGMIPSVGKEAERGSEAPSSTSRHGANVDDEAGTAGKAAPEEAGQDRVASTSRAGGAAPSIVEVPFEQRPALVRDATAMDTFARLNSALRSADDAFAQSYLLKDDCLSEAGPSSRPMQSATALSTVPIAGDLDTLRMLETSNKGGPLRAALTLHHAEQEDEESITPYPFTTSSLQDEKAEKATDDAGCEVGSWWNSTTHPSLLIGGMSELARSEQGAAKRLRRIGGRLPKRRKGQVIEEHGTDKVTSAAAESRFGEAASITDNVDTIVKLRRTHAKYGSLLGHVESGDPVPADLVVVSSDEEEGGDGAKRKRRSGIRGRRRSSIPRNRAMQTFGRRRQEKADDTLQVAEAEMRGNPFSKLGSENAKKILEHRMQLMLAHAGFEGVQRAASGVVTDVAGEFLMNLGRTLRSYVDRFAREMSIEELIMHTLFENGGIDVCSLESYVHDDVHRHGHKMTELLRKLRASYRDTLSSTELVMADEVAFFAGEGDATAAGGLRANRQRTAAGDADDDGEQIMRGGLALDVADEDFFGFKDLGLDAELGVDVGRQLAQLPSRMFQRRNPGDGGGKSGKGANAARDGKGGSGDDDIVDFPPPPPFVPLSEAAISAQIGLLQPFYRELVRSRGQWMRDPSSAEADGMDVDGNEMSRAPIGSNDENADQDRDPRQEGAYLVLPDEEQEKQRYRVPPTGKMPKRNFDESNALNPSSTRPLGAASAKNSAATAGSNSNSGTKQSTPLQSSLGNSSTTKTNNRTASVNLASTTTKKKSTTSKAAKSGANNHGRTGTPVTVS